MKKEPDYLDTDARTHVSFQVSDKVAANLLAVFLVENSIEFRFDPWPNDKWNFISKSQSNPRIKIDLFLRSINAKFSTVYCDGWD